jgi:hypothetical protein
VIPTLASWNRGAKVLRSMIGHSAARHPLTSPARRPARLVSVVARLAVATVALAAVIQPPAAAREYTFVNKGLDPFPADGPLMAVISLGSQRINVWDRNGLVASSPISSGRKGYETPEGVYSIIERKEEHFSNLYDDAAMPFMQRITWSGVALHAGVVPGYRASHGCVRLPGDFAERLYRTTRIATRVVIVPHDGAPMPISHPRLPQPGRMPTPTPADGAASPRTTSPSGEALGEAPMMLGARHLPRPTPAVAEAQVPTPADLRREQAAAARRLDEATRKAAEIKPKVRPLKLEQGRSEKALRQASAALRRAEGRVEAAARAVDKARVERAREAAVAAHIRALTALTEARGEEATARAKASEKAEAVTTIQQQAKAIEAERQEAMRLRSELQRRLQPVTVLVSRQTGRVYVRQSFQPVVELPVRIENRDMPLGTHVFTAMAPKSGAGVEWLGLTIETPGGGIPPGTEPAPPAKGKSRRGETLEASAAPPRPTPSAAEVLASATAALERVDLPAEALKAILPSIQPGSTLILSDHGPSIETGTGTDLVVQTKGEEQAAENIAKWVAKKKAEQELLQEASFEPRRSRRRDTGGDWQRW